MLNYRKAVWPCNWEDVKEKILENNKDFLFNNCMPSRNDVIHPIMEPLFKVQLSSWYIHKADGNAFLETTTNSG